MPSDRPENEVTKMDQFTDHDGKSTTASAVDSKHYPDPVEVPSLPIAPAAPSDSDIEAKARELWSAQGTDSNFEIEDWREQAQRELDSLAQSRAAIELIHDNAGSVQS